MELRRGSACVVLGFGVTGRAAASYLSERGLRVVVWEDHPTPESMRDAESLGVELRPVGENGTRVGEVLDGCSFVLSSPGVAEGHPLLREARLRGVEVFSDLDLAADDHRKMVAVTGTDGKTTVVTLVREMLVRSGISAAAVGNIGTPLVEACRDDAVTTFVVEASSFQLGRSKLFRADVGAWLNFAPDHLDVHASAEEYERAKARVWSKPAKPEAVAVANSDDPVVMRNVPDDRRLVTFGSEDGDYRREGETLIGPAGPICEVGEMKRRLPHDLENALAAAAIAEAAGATREAVRETLLHFTGLPHRVEVVCERDGVVWVDDSKATTPHATCAAVRSFSSVVLLAGGRSKGADLRELRAVVPAIRHLIAFGEAGEALREAVGDLVPVVVVRGLEEAVRAAADLAHAGDTVLLSPACSSHDAYPSYVERGRHFRRLVEESVGEGT